LTNLLTTFKMRIINGPLTIRKNTFPELLNKTTKIRFKLYLILGLYYKFFYGRNLWICVIK
jgi:hypothetical protein